MNKKRELEQQVTNLQAQVQELTKQLDGYRMQERAIVQALTDAQASAAKRISEGEAQAKRITDEANAYKTQTQAQADILVQEATLKAGEIVEAAQAESSRRLAQTEASVLDFESRLHALNAALLDTARQAKAQADGFSRTIEALTDNTPEILEEGRGLSALIKTHASDLPEDYHTPQELMHGIYQLQGRDLPFVEQGEQAAEVQTEQPAESEAPMEAEAPIAEPVDDEPEERIWTVEEVMAKSTISSSTPETIADEDGDVDLDSLLDEIIRE